MRQSYINRAQARVSAHLRAHNERIFPQPTRGLFNFRCHNNCVQWVKDHPDEGLEIVECIFLYEGSAENPILHYLVRDRDGRYLEVTTGYECLASEYYLVRKVPEEEWQKLPDIFSRSLNTWLLEFTHPLIRWALRVDRIL